MKQNIAIISGILMLVPQAYLFANEQEQEKYQNEDKYRQEMNIGMYQGAGQKQPDGKFIQPSGGSKMLPPFGNQGTNPMDMYNSGRPPMSENGKQWNMGSGMVDKMTKELENRKRIVEELKKVGVDVSGFTDAVMNDPQAFWKLAESLKAQKLNAMNEQWKSGSGMVDKMAKELENRKRIAQELIKLGADSTAFTDAIIADPQAFWKLAETYKYLKDQANKVMQDQKMMNKEYKNEEGKGMDGMKNIPNDEQKKGSQMPRPALTEKARKQLQDKLDKIPTDKRDVLLPKMLKAAQSQLETAQSKGNKVNVRKLEAIIAMIQDEIDSGDDVSLIDSITAQ